MDFQPSEEQQLIRDTVAAFAAEQVRPAARDADESGNIPSSLVQQAWELGLVQSTIPESLGGLGASPSAITGSLICEALGWGDLSIALHILAPQLLTQPVIALGSQEQQLHVLSSYVGPQFTAGSAAVLEPRFGFDINDLATTATHSNDGVMLNGTKCFVPLAAEAQHSIVYAQTDNGLGAYIVPHDTPGLTISEPEKTWA